MVARKRFLSDEDNRKSNNVFDAESPLEESSSFSDDSMYSFESLVASYDMEAGYEDLQLGNFWKIFSYFMRYHSKNSIIKCKNIVNDRIL